MGDDSGYVSDDGSASMDFFTDKDTLADKAMDSGEDGSSRYVFDDRIASMDLALGGDFIVPISDCINGRHEENSDESCCNWANLPDIFHDIIWEGHRSFSPSTSGFNTADLRACLRDGENYSQRHPWVSCLQEDVVDLLDDLFTNCLDVNVSNLGKALQRFGNSTEPSLPRSELGKALGEILGSN